MAHILLLTKNCQFHGEINEIMSTSDMLSREEVDSLLNETESQHCDGNRPLHYSGNYDLSLHARKAIEGIAQLETLNEIFCREASIAASHFMCQKSVFEGYHTEIITFNEYISSLERPVLINYVNLRPTNCQVLLIFSNKLTNNLIEGLFGGKVGDQVNIDREFGNAEIHIGRLFFEVLSKSLSKAWSSVESCLQFEYIKSVLNPSLVSIAEPQESVILSRFACIFNQVHNEFAIVYPQPAVNAIRKILSESPSTLDTQEQKIWRSSIRHNFDSVPLQVSAKTMQISMKLRQLIKLKVGDIIPIDNPSHALVQINNVTTFSGKCTKSAGKRVIQIEEKILE